MWRPHYLCQCWTQAVITASFLGVGAPEAVLVGVVALVVFGPKGLAEVPERPQGTRTTNCTSYKDAVAFRPAMELTALSAVQPAQAASRPCRCSCIVH